MVIDSWPETPLARQGMDPGTLYELEKAGVFEDSRNHNYIDMNKVAEAFKDGKLSEAVLKEVIRSHPDMSIDEDGNVRTKGGGPRDGFFTWKNLLKVLSVAGAAVTSERQKTEGPVSDPYESIRMSIETRYGSAGKTALTGAGGDYRGPNQGPEYGDTMIHSDPDLDEFLKDFVYRPESGEGSITPEQIYAFGKENDIFAPEMRLSLLKAGFSENVVEQMLKDYDVSGEVSIQPHPQDDTITGATMTTPEHTRSITDAGGYPVVGAIPGVVIRRISTLAGISVADATNRLTDPMQWVNLANTYGGIGLFMD
jgi:hypothetical protein